MLPPASWILDRREHYCKISLIYVNRLLSYYYCAKIQDGGRRHLELVIFVHFGQMFYFRWQPSTLLQNSIHLRQSAAELLLFLQKFKMAAAAILNLIFV